MVSCQSGHLALKSPVTMMLKLLYSCMRSLKNSVCESLKEFGRMYIFDNMILECVVMISIVVANELQYLSILFVFNVLFTIIVLV